MATSIVKSIKENVWVYQLVGLIFVLGTIYQKHETSLREIERIRFKVDQLVEANARVKSLEDGHAVLLNHINDMRRDILNLQRK